MRKKAFFVFNPFSGKGQIKDHLLDVVDIFSKSEYDFKIYATQGCSDGYNKILENADDIDMVVCGGGDGMLNESVSALMDLKGEGGKPALGYIPAGTTNDFATTLGISENMTEVAKGIVDGEVFRCDIGGFNDRYFSYIAAFGAFTDVAYETPQGHKNALGHFAYVLEGIKRLPSLKSTHMKVEHGFDTVEGDFIFGMISNTTSIAGVKTRMEATTQLNDGLFEVLLIKMPETMMDLQNTLSCLLKRDFNQKYFFSFHASEINITSDEEISWTLDGEDGGHYSSVQIKNYKEAISFILPKQSTALTE